MTTFTEINNWIISNFGLFDAEKVQQWFIFNPKAPILFNTMQFLCLFLVFYPIYILITRLKTRTFRNLYVFLFSVFFYYLSSGTYFALLLFSGVVDYNLAKILHQEESESYRKFYLILSVVVNLAFLSYFKYANFFAENYNIITGSNYFFEKVALPVGISFYTFQSMSYIIDIYRRELQPTKNILDYMFFVSFFPQLVAGPIVRASEFIPQIYAKLNLSRNDVNRALFLIIGGLIKKTVISDYISLNFVDRVFESPNTYTSFENLMAAYGYTIQIYCDFSGYSDMAIGIALLMGFKLSTNFRTPYKSASITEFWRRWHISLSTWLRDYLYISLGGNRKGKFRMYINLFLTMLLGGLWHGASWKFIVWGALHGTQLVIERLCKDYLKLPKNKLTWAISVFLTFHFVAFCWIFFRAKDFANANQILVNISNLEFDFNQFQTIILGYQNVFAVMLLGYLWHFLPTKITTIMERTFGQLPIVFKALVLAVTFWIVFAAASEGPQPFIYFQF